MKNVKFAVIYTFQVRPGMEDVFIESWNALTEFIYQYEDSYGSRLHRAGENLFISYAQWPDRETWEKSGEKTPPEATLYMLQMREACVEIHTEYELDVIENLSANKIFTS